MASAVRLINLMWARFHAEVPPAIAWDPANRAASARRSSRARSEDTPGSDGREDARVNAGLLVQHLGVDATLRRRRSAATWRTGPSRHRSLTLRALSALHGLEVYPELADDTSTLGSVLAGRDSGEQRRRRRLDRQRREVLEVPNTIGITEIHRRLASILDEVGEGRPMAILEREGRRLVHHAARVLAAPPPPSRAVAW